MSLEFSLNYLNCLFQSPNIASCWIIDPSKDNFVFDGRGIKEIKVKYAYRLIFCTARIIFNSALHEQESETMFAPS